MPVAVIILSLLLAAAAVIYILLDHAICDITKNLHEINESHTNAIVRVPAPGRNLENLAAEINITLEQKQEISAEHKRTIGRQRRDIANISHDLRTPLTSVIGYIQLLKDGSLTLEEREKYEDILLSRARSLQDLISGFYDLSRLESGEYLLDMKPVNLQNILCGVLASFYQDFLYRGVEPAVNIDQKAPPVLADGNAAKRIFTNLIQNALKHGGNNFKVNLNTENGHLITEFANEAPQLTKEDTERLFERFYTADRMRSGQNTGLGLAIVKELSERMGGVAAAELNNGQLSIKIRWNI